MTYFHGGHPNLAVGDYILPAAETGVPTTLDFLNAADKLKLRIKGREFFERDYRRDRVYISDNPEFAVYIGVIHRPAGFGLYEIEPIGEIQEDPDWSRNEEFFGLVGLGKMLMCERARIVDVLELPAEAIEQARRMVQRPDASIPHFQQRVADGRRKFNESDGAQQRRLARRAFEKQQRKMHRRARAR